jgi:general secretion pathway protein F
MPVFAYRALSAGGRTRAGVVGAESARAAWQELRARGVYPTELAEHAPAREWTLRRPGAAALAATTRQLATLVDAGVPLADALAAVAEQTDDPALVRALTVAHARLREGEPLADALAASPRVFPAVFRELVRAGEASGALPLVLGRLAEHGERSAAVRARLRAALTYPAVMTAATFAVLAFLLVWVVPQLTQLFADTGTPLPLATRALVTATWVAGIAFWPAVALGAALGWLAHRRRDELARRWDALLLRLPVVGTIARKTAVGRAARTLATLLGGGVPLDAALGIAGSAAGNRDIEAALARVRDAVRDGEPLATALAASGAFPGLVVRLVAIGERSGTLAAMLERAATGYETDVAAAIESATALVEPALVVVMGAVVLALVAGVLVPLLDLGGVVR